MLQELGPLGRAVIRRFTQGPCFLASLILLRSSQDFMPGVAGEEGQLFWLAEVLVLGKGECESSDLGCIQDLSPMISHCTVNEVTPEVGWHCSCQPSCSRWYNFQFMGITNTPVFPKPSDTGLPKHLPSVSYFLLTILNISHVGALRLPVWGFT